MILHPKFLDLTVDDLPDGEYSKAVTDGDQTIESLLTFYRAPRVQSIPATPNPRDLITRGQVRALAEQVIERSRPLDWDFSGGPVLVVDPTPAVPEPAASRAPKPHGRARPTSFVDSADQQWPAAAACASLRAASAGPARRR